MEQKNFDEAKIIHDNNGTIDQNMKLALQNISLREDDLYLEVHGENNLRRKSYISDGEIAQQLVMKTTTDWYRFDTNREQWFFYSERLGYYVELTQLTVESMLAVLLKDVLGFYLNPSRIKSITNALKQNDRVTIHSASMYDRYLVFTDGVLDLATGLTFPLTPKIFVVEGRQLKIPMPNFKKDIDLADLKHFFVFLNSFCNSDREVFTLLRYLMKTLYVPRNISKILIISGPSGTGKSVFVRLLTTLVGLRNSVATTFKQVRESRFETSLFKNKKLVIFSDTTINHRDVSLLKDLSGGDQIGGEQKYQVKKESYYFSGLIIIVTNDEVINKLGHDPDGALRRRIISIRPNVFYGKPEPLLENSGSNINGTLVAELPSILRWVLSMKDDIGSDLLEIEKIKFDSTENVFKTKSECQLMTQFIQACLQLDVDSEISLDWGIVNLVGLHSNWLNFLVEIGEQQNYITNPKQFTELFLVALKLMGVDHLIISKKGSSGRFYRGIRLRSQDEHSNFEEFGQENSGSMLAKLYPSLTNEQTFLLFGGTKKEQFFIEAHKKLLMSSGPCLSLELTAFSQVDSNCSNKTIEEDSKFFWCQAPIPEYTKLFEEDCKSKERVGSFRKDLLKISKDVASQIQVKQITKIYFQGPRWFSLPNYGLVLRKIDADLRCMQKFGFLVFNYGFLKRSKSRRLYSTKPTKSVHQVPELTRNLFANAFSDAIAVKGLVCVSVKINFCYLSLIAKDFPKLVKEIREKMALSDVWEIMESDFGLGKGDIETFFYIKLFGGTNQALMKHLLSFRRKQFGMTQDSFEKSDFYNEALMEAKEIVVKFEETEVFTLIAKLNKNVRKMLTPLRKKQIEGATGNKIDFASSPYNSAISCYYEDHEVSIMANLGLYLNKKLVVFEPCIHLHNCLIFLTEIKEIEMLNEKLLLFSSKTKEAFKIGSNDFDFDLKIFGNQNLDKEGT
jgi:phage/plasmid-associated DNA primase